MAKDGEERPRGTALPQLSFTLSNERRLSALASGPPAFALRRRRIEDLEAAIVRALAEHEGTTGAPVHAAPPARPLSPALPGLGGARSLLS